MCLDLAISLAEQTQVFDLRGALLSFPATFHPLSQGSTSQPTPPALPPSQRHAAFCILPGGWRELERVLGVYSLNKEAQSEQSQGQDLEAGFVSHCELSAPAHLRPTLKAQLV